MNNGISQEVGRSLIVSICGSKRCCQNSIWKISVTNFSFLNIVKRQQRKNLLAAHRVIYNEAELAVQKTINDGEK